MRQLDPKTGAPPAPRRFESREGWAAPTVQPPPSDHVKVTSHAILPPIRVEENYTPCNMWQSAPGEYVFGAPLSLAL